MSPPGMPPAHALLSIASRAGGFCSVFKSGLKCRLLGVAFLNHLLLFHICSQFTASFPKRPKEAKLPVLAVSPCKARRQALNKYSWEEWTRGSVDGLGTAGRYWQAGRLQRARASDGPGRALLGGNRMCAPHRVQNRTTRKKQWNFDKNRHVIKIRTRPCFPAAFLPHSRLRDLGAGAGSSPQTGERLFSPLRSCPLVARAAGWAPAPPGSGPRCTRRPARLRGERAPLPPGLAGGGLGALAREAATRCPFFARRPPTLMPSF